MKFGPSIFKVIEKLSQKYKRHKNQLLVKERAMLTPVMFGRGGRVSRHSPALKRLKGADEAANKAANDGDWDEFRRQREDAKAAEEDVRLESEGR